MEKGKKKQHHSLYTLTHSYSPTSYNLRWFWIGHIAAICLLLNYNRTRLPPFTSGNPTHPFTFLEPRYSTNFMYFKTSRDGFHSELQSCESVSRVVTYLSIRGGLRVSPPYGSCNILGLFFSLSTPSPNLFFPTLEFQAHNWMWRMWKIAFDFSSSLSFFSL